MKVCPSVIHSTVEYLVSRAILEGKIGSSSICIPLADFQTPHEELEFSEDAHEIILKLNISTEWTSADEIDELLETNLNEEEGSDDGFAESEDDGATGDSEQEEQRGKAKGTSSKNKKSH